MQPIVQCKDNAQQAVETAETLVSWVLSKLPKCFISHECTAEVSTNCFITLSTHYVACCFLTIWENFEKYSAQLVSNKSSLNNHKL